MGGSTPLTSNIMAKKAKTSPNTEEKKSHQCKWCFKLYATELGLTQHIGKMHAEERDEELEMARAAIENQMSAEEEHFCQLWASDREFFGNGTQSYIEAFDVKIVKKPNHDSDDNEMTYEMVRFAAHKLLTKANILKRINEIFESRGLNDAFVDKQLEVVITQNAEFSPKVKAIAEYNKLKKRTVVQVEHTHSFAKYEEMSDEELERSLQEGEKFFKKL